MAEETPQTINLRSGTCIYRAGFRVRRPYDSEPLMCVAVTADVNVFGCLSAKDKTTTPLVVLADSPTNRSTSLTSAIDYYLNAAFTAIHTALAFTGFAAVCHAPLASALWRWLAVDTFGEAAWYRGSHFQATTRPVLLELVGTEFSADAQARCQRWLESSAMPPGPAP